MKTVQEIIASQPVFLELFQNEIDVYSAFVGGQVTKEAYYGEPHVSSYVEGKKQEIKQFIQKGYHILFAFYKHTDWDSKAFVLYEHSGKLYEVNASHCSCHGLEEQWEVEEVILEELENRLTKGTFGENFEGNVFKNQLCEFLDIDYAVF